MSLVLALVTIFCWGSWMSTIQGVSSPNSRSRIFYATAANLVISALVFLISGASLQFKDFWLPFAGGLLWGIAGAFSFTATDRMGLARAVGTWASINTIAGLFWGALLFGELSHLALSSYLLTALSLVVLIAGIVILSVPEEGAGLPGRAAATGAAAKPAPKSRARLEGYLAVTLVGILWGSYFIPVSASGLSPLVASFPMAVGMFVASAAIALFERKPLSFAKPSHYARTFLAGSLWAAANYSMLFLCERIGRGRGFAVIQPNLAINALIGLYIFKEQAPRSRNFYRVLLGAVVTAIGGILFGIAK